MSEEHPCPACIMLVRELEKRMEQRFVDNERAVGKTEKELGRRLEEMNEFRGQINDERRNYIRKEEYESRTHQLFVRIELMERWQSRWMGISAAIIVLAGFVGASLGLIWGHLIR